MMFNSTQKKLYEAWAQTVFKASTLITDTVGLGFRPVWLDMFNYIQKYIGFNNIPKDAWILVLNDFDLTATKALKEMGYYNIIMLVTDTTEEQTPTTYFFDVKFEDRNFKKLFPNGWSEIWKDVWFLNAVEVQNVGDKGKLLKTTHIEYRIQGDATNMNFDLIIANPPYGKVGAQITDTIRKEVKYNHFVNLLPANDYKRVAGLHQHVRNMDPIQKGFKDAAVTTHLCEIAMEANNMTVEEFEISQYIDPQLDKYFRVLRTREHYAIDEGITWLVFAEMVDMKKVVLLDHRCIPNKHLAYSTDTNEYLWNVAESIDNTWLSKNSASKSTPGRMNKYVIKLNTEIEKQNMVQFIYSTAGFKFISKVFKALNTDSTLSLSFWLPKVDWTRAWTVEEILANYGYTETEIAEVMADLENFRDMERD